MPSVIDKLVQLHFAEGPYDEHSIYVSGQVSNTIKEDIRRVIKGVHNVAEVLDHIDGGFVVVVDVTQAPRGTTSGWVNWVMDDVVMGIANYCRKAAKTAKSPGRSVSAPESRGYINKPSQR